MSKKKFITATLILTLFCAALEILSNTNANTNSTSLIEWAFLPSKFTRLLGAAAWILGATLAIRGVRPWEQPFWPTWGRSLRTATGMILSVGLRLLPFIILLIILLASIFLNFFQVFVGDPLMYPLMLFVMLLIGLLSIYITVQGTFYFWLSSIYAVLHHDQFFVKRGEWIMLLANISTGAKFKFLGIWFAINLGINFGLFALRNLGHTLLGPVSNPYLHVLLDLSNEWIFNSASIIAAFFIAQVLCRQFLKLQARFAPPAPIPNQNSLP